MTRQMPVEDPCPISPAVDVLMGRWTSPILWMIEHHGGLRFNQLRDRLPSITPKVLTQRLRQLERDGFVTRTYHPEMPPRVEYEVTALGRTLVPLFKLLAAWSEQHIEDVLEARRRYDGAGAAARTSPQAPPERVPGPTGG